MRIKLKECISILSREFWLNGERQTTCCCLFIGFNDGSWDKAQYNDESCAWEINESDEIPDEKKSLGDSEFFYTYKQYLPASLDTGGEITKKQVKTNNELVILFSSGIELLLSYSTKAEKESVEINT